MPDHDDANRQPGLAPDDARVYEILRDIEDQYAIYMQVNDQPIIGEAWSDLPPQQGPDVPLSLTVSIDNHH